MHGVSAKRWKSVEMLAAPTVIVALIADALAAPSALIVASAGIAAAIHAARIAGWHSWLVLSRPILWILHAAYAWIPVGLVMLALAATGIVPHSLAIHALTAGAMGCAIIAMITRTALGHTGRMLVAGRAEIASYWLMIAAALLRVFGPLLAVSATGAWVDAAAVCWIAALVLYLLKYAPYLTAPRVDRKSG
nr:NnrS family protein [Paraburkholderia graminis]